MCFSPQQSQRNQNNNSTPLPNVAVIKSSLQLTPQEKQIVKYHDDTIAKGAVGKDDQGRPVTVYSTGIKIPPGEPNAGMFVSVPGYDNIKKKIMTEGEAYKHWESEIKSGNWPFYNSGKELNARSKAIHKIMDMEATKAIKARK
tara:strand:- start:155 stop:586 length:432 start_codon:yes stop_codon:yes gene_type:complete